MYSHRAFILLSDGQVEEAKADVERILKMVDELKQNTATREVYDLIKQRAYHDQVDGTALHLLNLWDVILQYVDYGIPVLSIVEAIQRILFALHPNNQASDLRQDSSLSLESFWLHFPPGASIWQLPFLAIAPPHWGRGENILTDKSRSWRYPFKAEEENRVRMRS